ncbi:MAG: hypothetical protein JSS63_10920 [Bacteroidetes bacterium]|nr:hypothetical protein [Bacteroidota bacterium]MBX7046849.1 hypothetical protein [Ignavibacteria bacterium]
MKVRELIPGKLKQSDIYYSEFEEMELEEFIERTKTDPKAKRMLKLIKHKERLIDKRKQTGRL